MKRLGFGGGANASYSLALVGLGFGEVALIAGVLLFFFGAKRLPEIAKGLGGGIRSFKTELKGGEEADQTRRLPPAEDPDSVRD